MTTNNFYFSLFGGTIYQESSDVEPILDAFQIPLKRKPDSSCKVCYGRMYTGYDCIQRHYILCSKCSKKCIDIDKIYERKRRSKKTKNN